MVLGPVGDKFGSRRTYGISLLLSGMSMVRMHTSFKCLKYIRIYLKYISTFYQNGSLNSSGQSGHYNTRLGGLEVESGGNGPMPEIYNNCLPMR